MDGVYRSIKPALLCAAETGLRGCLQSYALVRRLDCYCPVFYWLSPEGAQRPPQLLGKLVRPVKTGGARRLLQEPPEAVVVFGAEALFLLAREKEKETPFYMLWKRAEHRVLLSLEHMTEDCIRAHRAEELLAEATTICAAGGGSAKVLNQFTEKTVRVMSDPMLLVDKRCYLQQGERTALSSEKRYIFVDVAEQPQESRAQLEAYAERFAFSIVQLDNGVQYRNGTVVKAEPELFLQALSGAALVITDRYCTTLAATLFRRPFVVLGEEKEAALTRHYLKKLGLERHYIKTAARLRRRSTYRLDRVQGEALRVRLREIRSRQTLLLEAALVLLPRVDCPTGVKKMDCCGCGACAAVCSQRAITMQEDGEGFLYPQCDETRCTKCGLCEKRCIAAKHPRTIVYEEGYPAVYAAMNLDLEARLRATSGGVFQSLARYVLEVEHGVVFGMRYDTDMRVILSAARTVEEAAAFSGSKYVKGDTEGRYQQVRTLLQAGETVLYSGLPCECAGLRAYLGQSYESLYICEVLCHGAPSPAVFADYVAELSRSYRAKVTKVLFRDKRVLQDVGRHGVTVYFADRAPVSFQAKDCAYYLACNANLIQRPSCSRCRYTERSRAGDLTLGDFWGVREINPDMADGRGTSLVLVNNEQGARLWDRVSEQFRLMESTVVLAFQQNHRSPIPFLRARNAFFSAYRRGKPVSRLLLQIQKRM